MKKKFFTIILTICAVFSLAIFGIKLNPNEKASASVVADETYTITDLGNTLTITKNDGSELASGLETLSLALNEIINNVALTENFVAGINFNDVSLETEEQITLSQKFVFSGSLNTVNSSNLFLVQNLSTSQSLELAFENLNLTNTNNTLSDFSFIKVVGTGNTSITLNNTNFNLSTNSTTTSHSIKYISTGNTLTLKGEITHDTSLFFNHIGGNNMIIDEDEVNVSDNFYTDNEGNPLESSEVLKISVPYNAKDTKVSTSISLTNYQRFNIVEENDFFTISSYFNNNSIIASAIMNFNFDLNEATYTSGYSAPQTFYFSAGSTVYTFPKNENLYREYHTFDGWFGKVEYNETTYYFDQTTLKNYLDNNGLASDIETYFKTSLDEFSIDTSFSKYCNASSTTSRNVAEFESVKFFANNNLSPTFIAKWNIERYTISFDSFGGTETNSKTYDFGASVEEPTEPTKTGYTFDGWYTNERYETKINFSTYTMPATNVTLVAKWNINSYTISFITNSEETIEPITYNFGEQIAPLKTLTQTGNIFNGWYEYNEEDSSISDIKFNLNEMPTMPARNIILYAKWSTSQIYVFFNTLGGTFNTSGETNSAINYVEYNGYITIPATPSKEGYTFHGWFLDEECTNANQVQWTNDSKYQITERTTFYAKWIANEYHLEIYTNINGEVINKNVYFGDKVELPTNLTYANHKFNGWYEDENFETKLNQNQILTMPARDVSIYAKWTAKPLPTIDETPQVYGSNNFNPTFKNNSLIDGFIIRYFVNNEWTLDAPTEVGSYDVMITRNEDAKYARYSKVLKDAYVIEAVQQDLSWLIAILFILAALEITVSIIVRILRKMKRNMVISLAIPLGSTFISGNQVVLLAISGTLAIFGLILMVYQLVKLHRTVPSALTDLIEEDKTNENRFVQSNKVIEETNTYSADDIEAMLINDKVGQAIKEKHKLDEKDFSFEAQSTRAPIGPINYNADGEIDHLNEEDDINISEYENTKKAKVEIVEDEYKFDGDDEETKLFNSDDPFVRKNPDDYSKYDNDDSF